MKEILIKLLLTAAALAAITIYTVRDGGIWGDAETVRDRSGTAIDSRLVPPP